MGGSYQHRGAAYALTKGLTPERLEQITAWRAEGASLREIAERLEVSRRTLQRARALNPALDAVFSGPRPLAPASASAPALGEPVTPAAATTPAATAAELAPAAPSPLAGAAPALSPAAAEAPALPAEDLERVVAMAGKGWRARDVAIALGMPISKFERLVTRDAALAHAFETGRSRLHEKLITKLLRKAEKGETAPLIFSLKILFGYRENAPIVLDSSTRVEIKLPAALTPEQYHALSRHERDPMHLSARQRRTLGALPERHPDAAKRAEREYYAPPRGDEVAP